MKEILDFLSRYKSITPPDITIRKKLVEVIQEKTAVRLQERDIKIIGPVAYCAVESGLKNMLFLKKEDVLRRLEEVVGKTTIKDIQ